MLHAAFLCFFSARDMSGVDSMETRGMSSCIGVGSEAVTITALTPLVRVARFASMLLTDAMFLASHPCMAPEMLSVTSPSVERVQRVSEDRTLAES